MKKRIVGILLSCIMVLQSVVPAMAATEPVESVRVENKNQIQEYVTSDHKQHTIYWAKGVDAPKMSGTKGADGLYGDFRRSLDSPGTAYESEMYSLGFEEGKGYYDLNKEHPDTDHRCYLASAQNILYWWMDQNSAYIDQYLAGLESGRFSQSPDLANLSADQWAQLRKAPDVVTSDVTGMAGQYIDKSYVSRNHFMAYKSRNSGYYMDKVADFFINGYQPVRGDDPNTLEDYDQNKDGGFFFPIFGRNQISKRHSTSKYSYYDENMKNWILNGQGITIGHMILGGAHAIAVWGVEYDENGKLCRVYVTDSNDIYDESFNGNVARGIYSYDITDKDGLAYIGTYTDKVNRPGTMLTMAVTIDLSQDQWESALSDTNTEPDLPEIVTQPQGRSYGKGATAEALTVEAKISSEEEIQNAFLSYQWFKADAKDAKGTAIEGATKSSYVPVIGESPTTEYYYCEVSNNKYGKKNTLKSDVAEVITMDAELTNAKAPKITKNLTSQMEYTKGQTTGALKITAESVDNGTISYQWYSSLDADPANGSAIEGQTSDTFMPPTNEVGDRFYYFCKVTNTNETVTGTRTHTVNSNMVRVKVKEGLEQEPLTITNVPSEVHYKDEFILSAKGGSGATSVLSWEITSGNEFATVDSETGKVTVTGAGEFTVTATNTAVSYKPISDSVTITAKKLMPTVQEVKAEGTFYNTSAIDEIQAALKWTCDVEGSLILDADSFALTVGENELSWTFTPNDTANYEVAQGKVTVNCKEYVEPKPELVNAKEPKITKNLAGLMEYTMGQTSGELQVKAESVDNGTISYQWYQTSDGDPANGSVIQGQTGETFMPPTNEIGDGFYYFCKITNTNEAVTGTKTNTVNSNVVRVKVNPVPDQEPLTIINVPSEVYYKDEFTLSAQGGSEAPGELSWEIISGNEFATVDSVTGKVTVTGAGDFTVTATRTAEGYNPVSDSVMITARKLVPTVDGVMVEGTFYDTATFDEVKAALQWNSDVNGVLVLDSDSFVLVAGENELNWTFTPDDVANYEVVQGKVTVNCQEYVEPDPDPEPEPEPKPEPKPDPQPEPEPIETGWKLKIGYWYYYDENGSFVTGWNWIDGQCYYFYEDGKMAANTTIDGSYVNGSGAWVADQWVYGSGGWWYSYGAGGYAVGWEYIDGNWYYFDSYGYMVTGWNWIGGNCYYFYGSGAMAANTTIDGSYVNGSGAWVTDKWVNNGYGWWYSYAQGGYAVGWEYIDGSWYYFDSDGYMVTGWNWIDGKCYYFYGSGAMARNTTIDGSYVDGSGAWVTDKWVYGRYGWWYSYGSGGFAVGWKYMDGNWYYFDSYGYMVTGWNWIGGYCYYFYSSGEMARNTTIDGSYVDYSGAWVY